LAVPFPALYITYRACRPPNRQPLADWRRGASQAPLPGRGAGGCQPPSQSATSCRLAARSFSSSSTRVRSRRLPASLSRTNALSDADRPDSSSNSWASIVLSPGIDCCSVCCNTLLGYNYFKPKKTKKAGKGWRSPFRQDITVRRYTPQIEPAVRPFWPSL